ncbi:serine/threonine-protein kinase [Adhaeretor mobilis]|uniref:serine/threonine-protein kinase n=1 Tax=Adhaeretor mobilis TaxID=1930276 RepID=UPI0011A805E2|nr:serine/threonine-protein kinase [Adhaeretor mobilis]
MSDKPHSIFEQAGLASGLLTQDQIDAAWHAIATLAADADRSLEETSDQVLADCLVEQEILNRWQAVQLQEGRTKFTLGPYRVLDTIGKGGMGYVFKCEHELLGRIEAVKVLPKTHMAPESVASFRREIRAQAQLDHPNLVRLAFADRDGDIYYLITEYVPGSDLRRLIHNHGPLTTLQAALVISQAATALEYAHKNGLVHRDVKPGNVLVTPDGKTKLADLGLAVFSKDMAGDPHLPNRSIVGTPDFLAPEAITSPDKISPSSDIYALGCTFYYAVTGKVPFPGGTTKEKLRRQLEELPLTPQRLATEVEPAIIDLIADMMRKNPKQRIGSAADVIERLQPWISQIDESTWDDLGEYVLTASACDEDDSSLHETTPVESSEITHGAAGLKTDAEPFAAALVASDSRLDQARPDLPVIVVTDGASSSAPAESFPSEEFFGLGRSLAALIALAVIAALAAIITAIWNSF